MNQAQGLYAWFSTIDDIPAYPANSIPDDVTLPYRTYTPVFGDFDSPVSITANCWAYTESEVAVFEMVKAVVDRAKAQPFYVYDGGAILFYVDSGWGQDAPTDISPGLKVKTMNLTARFLSEWEAKLTKGDT